MAASCKSNTLLSIGKVFVVETPYWCVSVELHYAVPKGGRCSRWKVANCNSSTPLGSSPLGKQLELLIEAAEQRHPWDSSWSFRYCYSVSCFFLKVLTLLAILGFQSWNYLQTAKAFWKCPLLAPLCFSHDGSKKHSIASSLLPGNLFALLVFSKWYLHFMGKKWLTC